MATACRVHDVEGLADDLCSALLFDEATADVVLVVGATRLPAHRVILAARSPVFRAMFFGTMCESTAREVTVHTFAASTLQLLLRFVYSGHLQDVGLEEMVALTACADHLGMISLRDKIGAHLCDTVLPEAPCDVLALARQFHQHQLVELCVAHIQAHAQYLLQTDGIFSLDCAAWLKILESDETRMEEVHIFESLVRWWRAGHTAKWSEAEHRQLFDAIRYGLMTGPELVTTVRPLVGDVVSSGLYMTAVEHAAAPGVACVDKGPSKQCCQRLPPVSPIRVSDPKFLEVQNTTVLKVGPRGWNCSAVKKLCTSRTRFIVHQVADSNCGVCVGIVKPSRQRVGGDSGTTNFPRAEHFNSECALGILPSGAFFGGTTRHVSKARRWLRGAVLEVTTTWLEQPGKVRVVFSSKPLSLFDIEESVESVVETEQSLTLAVALYSPKDAIAIESVI